MLARTLKDFIGQRRVMEMLLITCDAAKKEDRPLPHMMFSGPPGLGKTSVAQALSNEMNGKFVSRIATAIKRPEDIVSLFEEVDKINTIVFIDEVEQLARPITELLHTALEGSRLTAKVKKSLVETELPEFTMITATNYPGELPKPFLDRFPLRLHFEAYTTDEIEKMILKHVSTLKHVFTNRAIRLIAERSFGTPRTGLGYVGRAYDLMLARNIMFTGHDGAVLAVTEKCVQDLFELLELDYLGLDKLDRSVMKTLADNVQPVGLMNLAQMLNEDKSSVELAENKLVQLGFVVKTPRGRLLSAQGANHLKKVG